MQLVLRTPSKWLHEYLQKGTMVDADDELLSLALMFQIRCHRVV